MAVKGPTSDHGEILFWAQSHAAVPVELLPLIVDSVPAELRLMNKEQAMDRPNVRIILWEDFFAKFDALGLALAYTDDSTGYNEILQREEESPYFHADYGPGRIEN